MINNAMSFGSIETAANKSQLSNLINMLGQACLLNHDYALPTWKAGALLQSR
jgi:hypothetical protein